MPLLNDTTPEARKVWADVYRSMPPHRKWRIMEDAFVTARKLHAAGLRLRDPQITPGKILQAWMKTHYGLDLKVDAMNTDPGNFQVLTEVVQVFAKLDIACALGGSMASSLHGIARFTQDADVTVEPFPGKEQALTSSFGRDYYLNLAAVQDAVRQRSSFNIIHTSAGFKVDVFVRKDDPFQESALSRRVSVSLGMETEGLIDVLTAEDVVLFKLHWYRLGQETSRRQLDDILGILRTRPVDEEYVNRWAKHLQVADLWQQMLSERGAG